MYLFHRGVKKWARFHKLVSREAELEFIHLYVARFPEFEQPGGQEYYVILKSGVYYDGREVKCQTVRRKEHPKWIARLKTDKAACFKGGPIVSDATLEMSRDPASGDTYDRIIKRFISFNHNIPNSPPVNHAGDNFPRLFFRKKGRETMAKGSKGTSIKPGSRAKAKTGKTKSVTNNAAVSTKGFPGGPNQNYTGKSRNTQFGRGM